MTVERLESYISSIFSWHMDWKCTCCTDTDGWTEAQLAVLIWQLQPGCGPQDRVFHQSAGTRRSFSSSLTVYFPGPLLLLTHNPSPYAANMKKVISLRWQQSNTGSSFLSKEGKLACRSQAHSAESRDSIDSVVLHKCWEGNFLKQTTVYCLFLT